MRTYIHTSRAHYASQLKDERHADEVILCDSEAEHEAELVIKWHDFNDIYPEESPREPLTMFVRLTWDCLSAYTVYADVFERLLHLREKRGSRNGSPQPKEFCKILESLGIQDATPLKKETPHEDHRCR